MLSYAKRWWASHAARGAAPAPPSPLRIDSVTPSTGSVLGGTEIVIEGSGFLGMTQLPDDVQLDGVPVADVLSHTDTEIVAITAPHAAPGAVDVTVTASMEIALAAGAFTYEYTKSVAFDGVDDKASATVAWPNGAWSVEWWCKRSANTNTFLAMLADNDIGTNAVSFQMRTGADNCDATVYLDDGSLEWITEVAAFSPAAWHHVAFTRTAGIDSDEIIFYVDGVAIDTEDVFAITASGNLNLNNIIFPPNGATTDATAVARAAIHASALSPATIAAHAADPQADWGSPTHEWIFGNDPTDSTALPGGLIHDQVGTAHLTPTGTVAGSIVDDFPA